MAHPMYEGKPRVFDAFSAHSDEVTMLPVNGSVHLATNAWTRVQVRLITQFSTSVCYSITSTSTYDLICVSHL